MLEPAREHRCSFQDPFPMAECLAGVPDDEDGRVPGAGVGPFPEADILIALDPAFPRQNGFPLTTSPVPSA